MCGIAGYYINNEILKNSDFSLERANSKISHRGLGPNIKYPYVYRHTTVFRVSE